VNASNMLDELWKQAQEGHVDALLPLADELADSGKLSSELSQELSDLAYTAMAEDDPATVTLAVACYHEILKRVKR